MASHPATTPAYREHVALFRADFDSLLHDLGNKMVTFDIVDLKERTSYELWILEHLRKNLFSQSEAPDGGFSTTLGNDSIGQYAHSISSFSQDAIEKTLNRFRPLAVAAAFKLQDMIVEWILCANGNTNWKFKQKIDFYNKLKAGGTLTEPSFFDTQANISNAFWSLYEKIEKPRGALIHTGYLKIESDGTLRVKDRDNNVTSFTAEIQAAYIRFCCVITRIFLGDISDKAYYELLINNDLVALAPLGCVSGFLPTSIRLEGLIINVPQNFAKCLDPYVVEIDFTPLIEKARETYPNSKLIFFPCIIAEASDRTITWRLPSDRLPNGRCEFREDDPALSAFISTKQRT